MKLTTIIMITTLLQVSAAGMAQQLTLKKKNVSLNQIFKEIRKQTGYSVLWESEKFDADEKITVDFNSTSLKEVLNSVVVSKGYSYLIDEKTIIIQSQINRVADASLLSKATIDVKGKIVDNNGAPLSGASVVLKSNGKGTSTAADGTFAMKGIEEGAILVIKFIGFDAKELTASKELGTIKMTPATSALDEVQIQAYRQTSKRLSLSNTASVKAKDIENQIISNPLLALQGRVAGLQIQQLSGTPGGSINVKIQGESSLLGETSPFFVVDGVPYSSTVMIGTGNATLWSRPTVSAPAPYGVQGGILALSGSGNPLNYLNPNDIESIEVLKDADATAIYGSRAANGAIIITTKKGKPGVLGIDLNIQSGWNKAPFGTKFLNTEQYIEIRREAYRNSNAVIPSTAYDINGTWDQTRYTDWQNELFKTTSYSNANLNISGGTINSNYRIGLTANREKSPYGNNFKNDNAAISLSLNTASANQRFKIGLLANYLNGFNNLPNLNNTIAGSFLPILTPNGPSLYNTDGSLNWDIDPTGTTTRFDNPLARYLTNPFEVKTNNLTSNITLGYSLLKGLVLKSSIGYTRMDQQEFSSALVVSQRPTSRSTFTRSGSFRFTNTNNFIVEPQILFDHQFTNHKFSVIVGGTFNRSQGETSGFSGSGQSSDSQVRNLAAAATFSQTGTNYYESKYIAAFSRIDYNYKGRYILGLSGRRDGSSRFGPANRFANFWSVAAGWIISEESWVKNNAKWLDFLKVKTSYGLTGSDGIGNYTYMDLFSPSTFNLPYQSIVGFTSGGLPNEGLQWEEKRSLNLGLDASLFNSVVSLGVNYNRNRSSNLLQYLTLPSMTGFGNVLINFDAVVQNTGWEFVLGLNVLNTKNFGWNLNANLTVPQNKLLSLPDASKIPAIYQGGYNIGQPVGSSKYYTYMGVNPLTGLEVLEDVNGNPVGALGALEKMKTENFSLNSPYYAGFQSVFRYKGFNLSLSFDYTKQFQPRYFTSTTSRPGTQPYNQPEITYYLNRWRNPGDVAVVQKYSTTNSSGWLTNNLVREYYVDATYLRLTNAAISWNLPVEWIRKIGMKNAGIGVNGQNLFIWSPYYGPNPITGAAGVLPPTKVITANFRASF